MTEIEYIGKESKSSKHSRKFYLKMAVFIAFLGILSLVIYTSFFNGFDFTGSVINGGNIVSEAKTLDFKANLNVPHLDLNGKFENVEIKGGADSYLEVGDQKFYLGSSKNNYMTFKNYNGELGFDEGKVLKMRGKASEITINGVVMSAQSKNTSKVNLENPFDYQFLNVFNQVQIKKISYFASGTLNVGNGKNAINVNNESITINGFTGNVGIVNKNISLNGKVQSLDVAGQSNIHIAA